MEVKEIRQNIIIKKIKSQMQKIIFLIHKDLKLFEKTNLIMA